MLEDKKDISYCSYVKCGYKKCLYYKMIKGCYCLNLLKKYNYYDLVAKYENWVRSKTEE